MAPLACGEDSAGPASPLDPPRPATVTLTPVKVEFATLGDTARMAAEVRDHRNRVMHAVSVAWSSTDTTVATVDQGGLITAIGDGDASIKAAVGVVSGRAQVSVVREVGAIAVTPSSRTISVGDTLRLVAEAEDTQGNPMTGVAYRWTSSNESVVDVTLTGLVRAIGEGMARVAAMAGAVSGSATITVTSADSDRTALAALYVATDGSNWNNSNNWLTNTPLGEWYGVTVDERGRVVSLSLDQNGLTGQLPWELGHLSELTWLHLYRNQLTGPIPREIGNLTHLTYLNLVGNHLSGGIPPTLGRLAVLRDLRLSRNRLAGPLPSELGDLKGLRYLLLSHNQLTGPAPGSLLTLGLEEFQFHDNEGLCIPGTAPFIAWAEAIEIQQWGQQLDGAYCNADDVSALLSLHQAAGGRTWTGSDGWGDVRWSSVTTGNTSRRQGVAALAFWYGVSVDSTGRVRGLDLSHNNLSGRLPADLARLTSMAELRIGGNDLSGPLPVALASVPLQTLDYSDTDLCIPDDSSFRDWLTSIPARVGSGTACTALSYQYALAALYEATGGASWINNDNWLTDAPLQEWYGVELDAEGRIAGLSLDNNGLVGSIPTELGDLGHLSVLSLDNNRLEGGLSPTLGNLTGLTRLSLRNNGLTGTIPPTFGRLRNLVTLHLSGNRLSHMAPELGDLVRLEVLDVARNDMRYADIWSRFGRLRSLRMLDLSDNRLLNIIPSEIGDLSNLEVLDLSGNDLIDRIPPSLGDLARLRVMDLSHEWNPSGVVSRLDGPIPAELGDLDALEVLDLNGNDLDNIPPELGNLTRLEVLDLGGNAFHHMIPESLGHLANLRKLLLREANLIGSIPAELGGLANLRRLDLSDNRELSGPLPLRLASLGQLAELLANGTLLCAPSDSLLLTFLRRTGAGSIPSCDRLSQAYLVQASQSIQFPVSLVAGEPALLRVFVATPDAGGASIPPVRARFYLGGEETHLVEVAAKSHPIPTRPDESSLAASANAEIPGWVIQPGLEMVVQIDPDGTIDPALGVAMRIPEHGRLPLDVRVVPPLDLTVIPFLYAAAPDSSILDLTEGLAGEDDLFWPTRALLPVGDRDFAVTVHDPVVTSTNHPRDLAVQALAIRTLEGSEGHFIGTIAGPTLVSAWMLSKSRAGFAAPDPWAIAHALGRTFRMEYAPCDFDPVRSSYPHPDGSIGAWGYDFRNDTVVPPDTPDLMSNCEPQWISEYNFNRALRFRMENETAMRAPSGSRSADQSLLLWGGVDEEGSPFLAPAFVVDAPPALPLEEGRYEVTGRADDRTTLFSVSFNMSVRDEDAPSAGFAFALPADPKWASVLASITLSGPGGSTTLDRETDRPAAIVRDPLTGQVRGILGALTPGPLPGDRAATLAGVSAVTLQLERGLEVLTSRGLPERAAWQH